MAVLGGGVSRLWSTIGGCGGGGGGGRCDNGTGPNGWCTNELSDCVIF